MRLELHNAKTLLSSDCVGIHPLGNYFVGMKERKSKLFFIALLGFLRKHNNHTNECELM